MTAPQWNPKVSYTIYPNKPGSNQPLRVGLGLPPTPSITAAEVRTIIKQLQQIVHEMEYD